VPAVSTRARIFALLPLAALGVHQLRYRLAFGHESDHELAAQGHAYLASLTPILVLLATLIAAELVFRLARAARGRATASPSTRFIALATAIGAALVAIYVAQELLEGLLETGHPGGLTGVFGDGGWWSVPIAMAFGAVIALFLRGADAVVATVARSHHRRRNRRMARRLEGPFDGCRSRPRSSCRGLHRSRRPRPVALLR
jgi:hypothetical protein